MVLQVNSNFRNPSKFDEHSTQILGSGDPSEWGIFKSLWCCGYCVLKHSFRVRYVSDFIAVGMWWSNNQDQLWWCSRPEAHLKWPSSLLTSTLESWYSYPNGTLALYLWESVGCHGRSLFSALHLNNNCGFFRCDACWMIGSNCPWWATCF